MFQGFKVRPTIQLAVRKWTVLHTTCLYLSQIRLRYATGVNGNADRIQSEGPGPNSKASHVWVMSLDYYAGVETVCCASPLWKETAMNHIRWTNADRKWPACMCIYIYTVSTCFGARLPVSALLSESTGYINSQRQQILYICNSHDYKLGMKRNNVNHTQVFQSFQCLVTTLAITLNLHLPASPTTKYIDNDALWVEESCELPEHLAERKKKTASTIWTSRLFFFFQRMERETRTPFM